MHLNWNTCEGFNMVVKMAAKMDANDIDNIDTFPELCQFMKNWDNTYCMCFEIINNLPNTFIVCCQEMILLKNSKWPPKWLQNDVNNVFSVKYKNNKYKLNVWTWLKCHYIQNRSIICIIRKQLIQTEINSILNVNYYRTSWPWVVGLNRYIPSFPKIQESTLFHKVSYWPLTFLPEFESLLPWIPSYQYLRPV